MRLYLSSFRMGNQPQELMRLVYDGRRVAVIANAIDVYDQRTREEGVALEVDHLRKLGFDAQEVDLRQYFGRSQQLAQTLAQFNLLWVRGGNGFVLRRAFKLSRFDDLLKQLLAQDAVAYGGYSARVCILSPSLHGIELVDDPSHIPDGYEAEIIWECLGVLPYMVAPHYRSNHPESAAIEQVVQYFIDHHILFRYCQRIRRSGGNGRVRKRKHIAERREAWEREPLADQFHASYLIPLLESGL